MADNKNSESSGGWSPNLNHFLLACLAGILFMTQSPFHKSRPEQAKTNDTTDYTVSAKVWEDPFEAIHQKLENDKAKTKEQDKVNELVAVIKHDESNNKPNKPSEEETESLANIWQGINADTLKEINVLAVMLPSEFYYEDIETRRRLRYAVLSGFNTALLYMPKLHNQIKYFQYLQNEEKLKKHFSAYEWMVYKPIDAGIDKSFDNNLQRPPVLLLWLNKDDFRDTPHQNLQHLIDKIKESLKNKEESSKIVNVSVLAPFDSDGLQDLFGEVRQGSANTNTEIRYYSPHAMIKEDILLKDNDSIIEKDLNEYFYNHGIDFLRVNATDQQLAKTIKQELKLRGIEPSKNNRILLVGEWDKLYTFHLIETFFTELLSGRKKYCPDKNHPSGIQQWNKQYEIDEQCIFRVSYLRTLDGEKSKANKDTEKSVSDSKSSNDTKSILTNLEQADGDSQFDYVRRMANQIEALDKQIRQFPDAHAIKAIGILGSDVYDKLLISEALHSKFPDAVFFTTGMDARLLEPKYNLWTKNMLVASSFGLELNRNLQKNIPPFRDSVQTAYFFATEMALVHQFAHSKDLSALQFKQEDKNVAELFNENINIINSIEKYKENIFQYKYSLKENSNINDDSFKQSLNIIGKYNNIKYTYSDPSQAEIKKTQSEQYSLLLTSSQTQTRIFEIGRTKAFDLSIDCNAPEKSCLHPEKIKHENVIKQVTVFWIILIIIFIALFIYSIIENFILTLPIPIISSENKKTSRQLIDFLGQKFGNKFILALTILITLVSDAVILSPEIYQSILLFLILYILFIYIAITHDNDDISNSATISLSFGYILAGLLINGTFIWSFTKGDYSEPYALLEGVSILPSQAIRFIAFILASYFIIKVFRFPKEFTNWLEDSFNIESIGNYADNLVLDDWLKWNNSDKRYYIPLGFSAVFYFICVGVLLYFGMPQVPYRGDYLFALNQILMIGLLVPAFCILLWAVTESVRKAVDLIGNCFPDNLTKSVKWHSNMLSKYQQADYFNLVIEDDAHEWVGMRFIVELTKRIYAFIGYPMVVILLMAIARSSYFDNWQMPNSLKLVIGFSVVWLWYWDYRLKKAADVARNNALKSLQARIIRYKKVDKSENTIEQLEKLMEMIKDYDASVYKGFMQRPIFSYSLLVMLAVMMDSVDISLIEKLPIGF